MTPRLTTDYAKNYCNRILIVKVIVENVVTFFYGTQCRIRQRATDESSIRIPAHAHFPDTKQ